MKSLAWRYLKSFAWNSLASLNPLAELKEPAELLPQPRLTIRVGVAGHLDLRQKDDDIRPVVLDVLEQIVTCCKKLETEYHACFRSPAAVKQEPCFRLVTSLAAGGDQLCAKIASDMGFELQVVLPTERDAFRADIEKNAPKATRKIAGATFDELLRKKEGLNQPVVFELDGSFTRSPINRKSKNNRVYAAAARVLLAHSDLLVAILSRDAKGQTGGTLWLVRRAIRLEVPVVLIPIEEPEKAEVVWHHGGKLLRKYLNAPETGEDAACVIQSVLRPLLLLPKKLRPPANETRRNPLAPRSAPDVAFKGLPDSGWFERAYRDRLRIDKNRGYWNQRWGTGDFADCVSTAAVQRLVDSNFREFAVWADHRASAYGEMYRGAFACAAVLGASAVSFALLNVMFTGWSVFAKFTELILLAVVLVMYFRAKRLGWKERWLNYRRLERHLNAAAWLALLGKTIHRPVPAHGSAFNDRAEWENWLTRAVLRQASLPAIQISRQYLNNVRDLFLAGVVRDQIGYYEREIAEHEFTEHRLERLGKRCLTWAFLGTFGYLVFHVLYDHHWLGIIPGYDDARNVLFAALAAGSAEHPGHTLLESGRRLAIVLGAGLPAWATALTAIRTHGEHSQIALRYAGQIAALKRIENRFNLLTDAPAGASPLRIAPLAWKSADLARLMMETTNALTDEVHHWHSMLFTKEIEPA